jgi:diadenosine tetraphosphate (Ap4A) HIT family hydrolase
MLYKEFLKARIRQYKGRFCPFCAEARWKIIQKNSRSFITYSLAPYHKHHLLVISDRHAVSFLELSTAETRDIERMLSLGVRLLHACGYKDCLILVHDGKSSGKSVEHLHYHVIPNTHIGALDHLGHDRKIMSERAVSKLLAEFRKTGAKLR